MRPVFRVLWLLAALSGLGASACSDNDECEPGEPCECFGGHECYLGCSGDGCAQRCFQMDHCGAVCDDACQLEFFDVQTSSGSCGADCTVACHNANQCGVICGERCHFDCHDMQTCGVRAGEGSTIICNNFSTCDVECTGTCRVQCNAPDTCNISCLGGAGLTQCPDGSSACGPC